MSSVDKDRQLVVKLLNDAKLETNREAKITKLRQVEEILIHKHPDTLLPEFLQNVLEFHLENTPYVRKFLAGFVESVCKKNASYIQQCAETLLYLSNDASANVIKKVCSAATAVYAKALQLICKEEKPSSELAKIWGILTQLKRKTLLWLEYDNDGVKTHALHFIGKLCLAYSPKPSLPLLVSNRNGTKVTVKSKQDDFDLTMVPSKHQLLSVSGLQKEADQYVGLLIERLFRIDTTATNISVILQVLFNIVKQRKVWWDKIIPAIAKFARSIPSNLTSSQIASIEVSLKSILLYLLRMPDTKEYRNSIVDSLHALQVESSIIDRAIHYADKSSKEQTEEAPSSKRRLDENEVEMPERKIQRFEEPETKPVEKQRLFDTPLGQLPAPVIANIVVDTLLRSEVNIMGAPKPPLPTVQAFIAILFNTLSKVLSPGDLSAVLNYISPPQQQKDVSRDPRMRALMEPVKEEKPVKMEKVEPITREIPPLFQPPMNVPPVPPLVQPPMIPDIPQQFIQPEQKHIPQPIQEPTQVVQPTQVVPPVTVIYSKRQDLSKKVKQEETPPEESKEKIEKKVTQLAEEFKVKVSTLTEQQRTSLLDLGWKRMLKSEKDLEREGRQHVRLALISRFVAEEPEDSKYFKQVLDHIKSDLQGKFGLLIQWLFQEYANECLQQFDEKEMTEHLPLQPNEDESRYTKLFHMFLQIYKEQLQENDLLFTRLLVEAPKMTDKAIQMVYEYVENPSRVTVGLITLRDIIVFREPLRDQCLQKLLNYATHKNNQIRTPSIRLVRNQLFPMKEFSEKIEKFATEMLEKLLKPPEIQESKEPDDTEMKDIKEEKKDDEMAVEEQKQETSKEQTSEPKPEESKEKKPEEQATESEKKETSDQQEAKEPQATKPTWTPEEIQRHSVLFLALCIQKQELLNKLVSVYTRINYCTPSEEPKLTLLREMDGLIRTLGTQSKVLLDFLANYPPEAEELALHFVQSLVKANPTPPPALLNAIKGMFFGRKNPNARFLLPILPFLTKDEIKSALNAIIQLPKPLLEAAFKRILTMDSPNALSPAELMIALHQLDIEDGALIKQVIAATKLLFSYKNIYNKNVLAIVLQQLVELHPIPPLFMRTVIQSVVNSPELARFTIGILSRLVKKRVWQSPVLWEGFIRCVKMPYLTPHSYEVLLQLPVKELEKVIKQDTELRDNLKQYVNTLKDFRLKNKTLWQLLEPESK